MPEETQIRLVQVEFLRPGPPHNQLLSPLTQYLAIAGDAGAGVVTVPYEHAEFERRLKELRYETGDPDDRHAVLEITGREIGRMLGAVPGLSGALASNSGRPGDLIHLRLTLSASELALLPFELAEAPVTSTQTAGTWLSIQSRPPICLTRNIRTVSPEGVQWPHDPRILFISGDPQEVPYKEHLKAMLDAIRPFRGRIRRGEELLDALSPPEDGLRESLSEQLTLLVNPTLAEVMRECRDNAYTHVHILTHGDETQASHDAYGLVMRGENDASDVVSGRQFAVALTPVGCSRIHRPTVVTVASCDSGNVGSVIIPGASFAHALHQAGVPLVVASQFPLSKEGSIPLTKRLYDGFLWGQHPIELLQSIRAEMHVRLAARWHDWASLVVYEALPQKLNDQLEGTKYVQTRRAMYRGLEELDAFVEQPNDREQLEDIVQRVEHALTRMPLRGGYGVECIGLRASARKRQSEAMFRGKVVPNGTTLRDPIALLEEAWRDYERAARTLLVNDGEAAQRIATLHWVLVQLVALSAVLGKPFDQGRWSAAKLSAELYSEHNDPTQRAWAYGSLAELCLVRLADPTLSSADRGAIAKEAIDHAAQIVELLTSGDVAAVKSTRRQFQRYVDWWSDARFVDELRTRNIVRPGWDVRDGVLEVAQRLVDKLPPPSPAPPPSSPPRGGGGSAPPASGPPTAPTTPPGGAAGGGWTAAPPPSSPLLGGPRRGQFFDVDMLPAGHGDSLWIEYGDDTAKHRVLVDCGTHGTAKELRRRVEGLTEAQRRFDLFVMSHVDADHIGGALPFLRTLRHDVKVDDLWFNGWRHLGGQLGARQGEMFSSAIRDFGLPWNRFRDGAAIVVDGDTLPECTLAGGMHLTLLSPTPATLSKLAPVWRRELKRSGLEPGSRVDYGRFLKGKPSTSTDVDALAETEFEGDKGAPNGSSIAVLAEYGGASVLLGADAHAPVLERSIRSLIRRRGGRRLKVDAFKVSHHGSQNNVSKELLQLLDCRHYLVSSNGDHFYHPDREAIARIVKYGRPDDGRPDGGDPVIHFNYKSRYSAVWERPDLQEKHGYRASYPAHERAGATVELLEARSAA